MTHLQQYNHVFTELFGVAEEELSALIYLRGKWDSLQHIEMITMMEDTFDISINSTDVILFNSYEKGKEILRKYGVEV
ncbi:acyl carrier protein [Clostridium merdae]|uniref:acyl carrier protein n=1 Tax=Clostridium merdae TaxID=1958780 RepID=UPI000A272394|nr:acyl carrier protein [Clostridium merdae]